MERLSRRDILKRAAIGLSATAVEALLTACGGTTPTATTAPVPSSAPASSAPTGGGGRLVIGTDLNDVLTFDPGTHYEIISSQIMGVIYEGLVGQFMPDLTKLAPVLAKEEPTKENGGIFADGKVYAFKLREKVTFHSGNAMTAEDVAFSAKHLAYLKRNPSFLSDPYTTADGKVNVEAVDPLTVKFTLNEANVAFLSSMSTANNVVLDSKAVKAKGGLDTADAKDNDKAKDWLDQHSEGTRPYKLIPFKSKEAVAAPVNAAAPRAGVGCPPIRLGRPPGRHSALARPGWRHCCWRRWHVSVGRRLRGSGSAAVGLRTPERWARDSGVGDGRNGGSDG